MALHIFYINLDRRNDRREFMERQFAGSGLTAERISATTPETLPPEALRYCDEKRTRWVSPVELACSYSHRQFWNIVKSRKLDAAIVFEDDVVLSRRLVSKLETISRALQVIDIVRLETRNMPVLMSSEEGEMRKIFSFHYGSAGYAISKRAAFRLLEDQRYDVPLDDFLFEPHGRIYRRLQMRQIVPGLCITADQLRDSATDGLASSDIGMDGLDRARKIRQARRKFGVRMLKHAGRRAVDLVVDAIARSLGLARKASWTRVPFE